MNAIKTSALAAILVAALPVAAQAQTAAAAKPAAPAAPRGDGGGDAGGGHGKGQFMETYDANSDGKVTKAEFAAKRAADLKDIDLNENGAINELEYVTEYTFRLDKDLADRRARQIRQAHVRFGVLDTNKDGILSAEEFAASGDRMFSRLDTSGDGNIDAADTAKSF